MKQTTKQFLGVAAISAVIIGATTGVFGHGGFGPGWAGHHGMMGGPGGMHGPGGGAGWMMSGDPVAYADQQLTRLKETIGITSDQEVAWNTYADSVKGKAGLMFAHRQTMFGSGSTTPEQRLTFHEQGLEQMQKVTIASRDLYTVLTPEQQVKAGNLMGFRHGIR